MKIAILTSSLDTTNGWGRYSVNVTKALQAQGVTCVVFTEDTTRPVGLDVEIHRLRSRPGSGLKNILRIALDWWRLRAYARSCDVCHALTETHVFLAWLWGRPYVVSTHGTYTLRFFKRALFRAAARRAFRGAYAVIITSAFTHERIRRYVTLKRTLLLPNGVDTSVFRPDERVTKQAHSFITVGAIKPRKGQDIGLRALRELVRYFPDARYTIVGKSEFGAFHETLIEFVRSNALSDRVSFEHDVSDSRLVELYNQSATFVLPSRVDESDSFEGYPLALLEASACGLPIIGSTGCGAEHLIQDGETGYLVQPEDVGGLTARLKGLFEDAQMRQAMGERARKVAGELSWTENAKHVISLYRSATS